MANIYIYSGDTNHPNRLRWNATLIFYFKDLKLSFLKHDFAVQRMIHGPYFFLTNIFEFFYEKVKNLFWLRVKTLY